ncbi:hypothetical protein Q4Q35_13790 [Flavivirga aquimarina]|uniref:DUF2971 domain-containing protein n=1 Tax=Flavivirga aquimarina TaxID=2027862 RepID=A0ABT8WCN8_9FLAO|nr:hypothetical protein [Flavivirga aquimarina]MDO5970880.1 hypothetical protein [Flavivirga aquimarina]
MNKFGLLDFKNITKIPSRELLIFDKIFIPDLYNQIRLSFDNNRKPKWLLADLEYLISQGVISELEFFSSEHENFYNNLMRYEFKLNENNYPNWGNNTLIDCLKKVTYTSIDEKIYDGTDPDDIHYYNRVMMDDECEKEWNEISQMNPLGFEYISNHVKRIKNNEGYLNLKYLSVYLSEFKNQSTLPIISHPNLFLFNNNNKRFGEALRVVIKKISLPDLNTPLEEIIQFRKDKEIIHKLRALRLWIHDISEKKEDPKIISEKLDHLVDEYNVYMNLQKAKFNTSSFEFVVTTTADVIENMVKLNLGKISSSLFKLKHRKITLLEKEMKAPGREIAYISLTNEKFG